MANTAQLVLQFQSDLPRRHRSLKECVAAGIFARGVVAVAGQLDLSPSHLSETLSGKRDRKFDVEDFELYMQVTGDLTPLHYLIARFLPGPDAQQAAAQARAKTAAQQFLDALGETQIAPKPRRRRA